jgi:hypothetical protein
MTVETKPNLESVTVDSSEDVPGSVERSVEAHATVLSVEMTVETKPNLESKTVDSGEDVPGSEERSVKAHATALGGERHRDLVDAGQKRQAALDQVHARAARHSLHNRDWGHSCYDNAVFRDTDPH